MHFPKLLVLGATGRIGTILRSHWPEGAAIWAGRPGAIPHATGWRAVDPLADPAGLVRAADGADTILCLAGVTNARAARGANLADNITLALAAVRAGAAVGARVLLASSAAVYGDRAGWLTEQTPLTPLSDYGRAKAAMERDAARLAAELGVAATSLRIGNIAGADAILGGWRPGFALDRFDDGRTPRRSYIGPATLARVLADLAAAPGLPGVLNLATPEPVEMGALLDAAGLVWTPRPAPAEAIPEVALSVARLQGFTTLSARDSLPQTLVAEWRGKPA